MAAELVAGFQRPLQVDLAAERPVGKRRARQGLARGFDVEIAAGIVAAGFDNRQAGAAAGDGGADGDRSGIVAASDTYADAGVQRRNRAHRADIGNDAGEHYQCFLT